MSAARRLRINLRPSLALAGLILAAHAAAAAAALVTFSNPLRWLLAAALLALGAASAWSRALLRAESSIRAIDIGPQDLALVSTDGQRHEARAGERRYVSRLVVMLPLRRPWRRTLLVTAGMLDPSAFRRLRLWALWGRVPPVAGVQLSE